MNWLKSFWRTLNTPTASPREMADPQPPASLKSMPDFTPRAQQVFALARKEAQRFNHNFVGTEHVLLGLVALGRGTAVNVLLKMGLDLNSIREEIEKQVGCGPDQPVSGTIPYTPRVRKVLSLAAKEAAAVNHTYVGTEHLLLGLLREGDGVAARVLKNFDVDLEGTRGKILKELAPKGDATPEAAPVLESKTAALSVEPNAPTKTILATAHRELVDTSKRYDIYCGQGNQPTLIYRNVRFKGVKSLFPNRGYDQFAEFIELEPADGQTVFVAKTSIVRFCEHIEMPAGPE